MKWNSSVTSASPVLCSILMIPLVLMVDVLKNVVFSLAQQCWVFHVLISSKFSLVRPSTITIPGSFNIVRVETLFLDRNPTMIALFVSAESSLTLCTSLMPVSHRKVLDDCFLLIALSFFPLV